MLNSVEEPEARTQAPPSGEPVRRYRQFVAKFLVGWLFSLLILAVIGLSINIEWLRPEIEKGMVAAFNRPVKLGRLAWTLGLNGLSVWTDRLEIAGRHEEPFVRASRSEIGVAFLPLFEHHIIVKHLKFKGPDLWLVRQGPGRWNFSDLMEQGPDVRFLEIEDGVVHLRNKSVQSSDHSVAWQSYDLRAVNLKLIAPGKRRSWPFFLSFELDHKDRALAPGASKATDAAASYTTRFRLSAMGEGQGLTFGKQRYQIELDAKDLNLKDLEPLIGSTSGAQALVTMHFQGSGQVDDGVSGVMQLTARNVILDLAQRDDGTGIVQAENATCTGDIVVSPSRVSWENLRLEYAGMEGTTTGSLDNWRQAQRTWQAKVETANTDLSTSAGRLARQLIASVRKPGDCSILPRLSGHAAVCVEASGNENGMHAGATLDAADVPALAVLSSQGLSETPLLQSLPLTEDARVSGRVQVDESGKATFKNLKLVTDAATIAMTGSVDADKHEQHIEFTADSFNLDRATAGKKGLAELLPDNLEQRFDLSRWQVRGLADLSGVIDQDPAQNSGRPQVRMKALFKDCRLSFAGSDASVSGMHGVAHYDGQSLRVNGLKGHLSGTQSGNLGDFEMTGVLSGAADRAVNMELRGRNLDVALFVQALSANGINLACGDVTLAGGRLADVALTASGSAASPKIKAQIACHSLLLKVPTAGQKTCELKVAGGELSFQRQDKQGLFNFKDVNLELPSGVVTASGSCTDSDKGLVVASLSVRSRGVDIKDLHLLSGVHSSGSKDGARQLMSWIAGSQLTGRLYGDLTIKPADQFPLDGVIGLQNVSGMIGAGKVPTPFKDAGGVVAVSGAELVLQAVSLRVGDSMLLSDGTIKGYLAAKPLLQLTIKGQLKPQDLSNIMAGPGGQLPLNLTMGSRTPLAVQSVISGTPGDLDATFYMQADARNSAYLANHFGKLNQPPDTALTVDGSLHYKQNPKDRLLSVPKFHVVAGESVLEASGSCRSPSGDGPPSVEFTLSSPNPVPTRALIGTIAPAVDSKGSTGTVVGTISVSGSAESFVWKGEATLADVGVPELGLSRLDGKLVLPSWSGKRAGVPSEAVLKLSTATLRGVELRNLKAKMHFEDQDTSRVRLSEFGAEVSQGKVSGTGWYRPQNQRWHLDLAWDSIAIAELFAAADKSGGVTGIASGDTTLDSYGLEREKILRNVNGSGTLLLKSGRVNNLGKLEEKLVHANLLQQGLFGFNVNNLVQSVLPVKTGEFKEVTCAFTVADGMVTTDQLRFEGNDLRMWAAGQLDLPKSSLQMEVAGCLPRVTSSLLSGAIGEVSRQVTVQKVLGVLTFRKLENLPPLPLLGDLAADNPRAFMFKVTSAPGRSPDAVAHAIEKSFKWLPNKANASAHPVPRI